MRRDDPAAFLAALTGSFTLQRVEGHTESTWTPRGFAAQADLGAVTGGQASLAARARATVREALPLLDALTPLDPAADPQDCEAFRALVRDDVQQLLAELSSPQLRQPRVDLIFGRLTGWAPELPTAGLVNAVTVDGHLSQLAKLFGIFTSSVNTLDEERDQTNFITLVDWIAGLLASWEDQRVELDPWSGVNAFLGSTLSVLGGQLTALADQVNEVEAALDSVLVDVGERQAIRLTDPAITLDGLLGWIEDFAVYEGKRVIDLGGRHGVLTAFLPTVEKLGIAVDKLLAAMKAPVQRGGGVIPPVLGCRSTLPEGFRTARVRVAITSLRARLSDMRCLARGVAHQPTIVEVPAPSVDLFSDGGTGGLGAVVATVEARDFDELRHEFALVQPGAVMTVGTAEPLGGDVWQVTFDGVDAVPTDVVEIQILEQGTLRRLDVADVVLVTQS
jgi:hypothetical protein